MTAYLFTKNKPSVKTFDGDFFVDCIYKTSFERLSMNRKRYLIRKCVNQTVAPRTCVNMSNKYLAVTCYNDTIMVGTF